MKASLSITRWRLACMLAVVVLVLGLSVPAALAQFIPPPNTINLSIEGCRNDGSPPITPTGTLPNADGRYVCQDPAFLDVNDDPYTSGNLGKGWNELDLVPFRLIATNSGAATVYNVIIAADKIDALTLGYDVITEPVVIPAGQLNGFSAPGCAVTFTAQADGPAITGGADVSIYRVLTITHPANATCVIDYAQRLSIESADYNGSNLQAYKFEEADFKGGKATIPLPVNQIEEQKLDKNMTATQDTNFLWNIIKNATPAEVKLGNTCDVNNPNKAEVTIRVDWEIFPGTPGMVTVVTNIYATNPAARALTVNVTDTISGDPDGPLGPETIQALNSASSGNVNLPANTANYLVFTHTFDAPATVSDLSDTATASYTDPVTGGPILSQTQATDTAAIQAGTQTNTTAIVKDTESISGNGLQYSADSTTVGSSDGTFTLDSTPYTLGTKLDKDSLALLWTSVTQNGILDCTDPFGCPNGFVEIKKTVYVDPVPKITSGALSDTATLTASDGFTASSGPASINISTSALVQLTLVKNIPDILQTGESITCNFDVKQGDTVVATPQFVFGAGETQKQTTISKLLPGDYTVVEKDCGGLVPSGGTTQTVDLKLPVCAATVTFDNIVGAGSAVAEVDKVTLPAGSENGWVMTLTGPGTNGGIKLTTSDSTPGSFERFVDPGTGADFLLLEGAYTISETPKTGWETPPASAGCSFTVNYPADIGKKFQCVYTNKMLGTIKINKVTDPAGGTGFGFTENIDKAGAFTLNDGETMTFSDVPAGPYAVTENDPKPSYDLVGLVCTEDKVEDSSTDLVKRKATINLDPGETVECTYTNRQRGMVELLKLTDGVQDPSMVWNFTLKGPEVNAADSTPPPLVDFNGAKLIPGQVYTLCETPIPAAWTLEWKVDTDGDGVPDTIIPFVPAVNYDPVDPSTGYSRVYDPNYVAPPSTYTNDTRCVNFVVDAGETLAFQIDNRFPGGEPRTIGFWKNWNTCTGGNQAATAAKNGGPAEGWYILDDLLNNPGYTIGILHLGSADCTKAVAILDKRDIVSGKKKADDAAYGLAAQLLAAELNLSAGAETCGAVVLAVNQAQTLLASISFNGTGDYLKGKNDATKRAAANALAATLDNYNNGFLCP